ncbi:hypothetical protein M9458_029053, partial [Cirrhinus mrigala]
ESIFTELICFIEKCRSDVTLLIRDQERAAVSQAEEQLEQLKKEIDELKRRNAELNQLSHTDDHDIVHFFQVTDLLKHRTEDFNKLLNLQGVCVLSLSVEFEVRLFLWIYRQLYCQ